MRSIAGQYVDAIVNNDEAAIGKLADELWSGEELESVSLYDPDGRCLWHLYSNLKDDQLPGDEVQLLKDRADFLSNRTLFRNVPVYEVIIPLNRKGKLYGFLKLHYSLREFYDKLKGTYYLLVMVFAAFVIASILGTWLTSNTIIRPLDSLTRGVKKVSQGDFTTEIAFSSPRELAVLTENFNQMVTRLRNTKAELHRYQTCLEENIIRIRAEQGETHRKLLHSEKLAGIGQLAAGVAHEINNPLTSIRMLSQLLLDTMKQGEDQRNLEEILKQSLRCEKIVKGLLSFARGRKVHHGTIEINSVLESSINSLRNQKTFSEIEVIEKLSAGPVFIEGDSDQLEEVFSNIVLNAVESMDGKGRLVVGSSLGDDVVKIDITDTGCGISKENLDRIFDPFYTSNNGHVGIGLGLSISYGIVLEHQGTIEAKSEAAKGSTFTVCLPRKGGKDENV